MYLYPPTPPVPSWQDIGWTLPLPLPLPFILFWISSIHSPFYCQFLSTILPSTSRYNHVASTIQACQVLLVSPLPPLLPFACVPAHSLTSHCKFFLSIIRSCFLNMVASTFDYRHVFMFITHSPSHYSVLYKTRMYNCQIYKTQTYE